MDGHRSLGRGHPPHPYRRGRILKVPERHERGEGRRLQGASRPEARIQRRQGAIHQRYQKRALCGEDSFLRSGLHPHALGRKDI